MLATYARWFASALDDRRRQTLKDRARRLIGTARPVPDRLSSGPPPLSPDDAARAWLATDWLIRVQAASWLRLAGLTEAAARLESIGPTSNHLDLVRAVDVLGSAIMIAGRRIDLTASIAGAERADDSDLVEQAAWEAWERASEAGGWVAASEAASVGVPAELAYATDLRVIECARDAHVRDELEAARRSIGDTAWATALHSVADEAWTAGWDAAHPAVDAQARAAAAHRHRPRRARRPQPRRRRRRRARGQPRRRRVRRQGAPHPRRARHRVVGLRHPPVGRRLRGRRHASRRAASGPQVQEMTRGAVEEGPWNAGMEAARGAVDEVLRDAPDLVARSVGAAVAREASGVAARGVALRAAAVARAQGASAAEATDGRRRRPRPHRRRAPGRRLRAARRAHRRRERDEGGRTG